MKELRNKKLVASDTIKMCCHSRSKKKLKALTAPSLRWGMPSATAELHFVIVLKYCTKAHHPK